METSVTCLCVTVKNGTARNTAAHATEHSSGPSVCVRKVYCGKMADCIRMPFEVLSGVGPGIDVLDGGPRASRGRGCFWHFRHLHPHSFESAEWRIVCPDCIWLVCEKLTIFPYGQYIIGIYVSLAFWWYSQVQDQSGGCSLQRNV